MASSRDDALLSDKERNHNVMVRSKEKKISDEDRKDAEATMLKTAVSNLVLEEKTYKPTLKKNTVILLMLIGYVLLNVLGALLFKLIERSPNEGLPHWLRDVKKEFLQNYSCLNEYQLEEFLARLEIASKDFVPLRGNATIYPHRWTFNNAFVLTFSIASTIGYGLVTPVTLGGQLFAIFFAFLSIPFTGILAAKLGTAMAYSATKMASKISPAPKYERCTCLCLILFPGLILYILLPTFLIFFIGNTEDRWTFANCLYCIIISLTTIGFGDFVPDPHENGGPAVSILVQLWVLAGLGWFASFIKLLALEMKRQAISLEHKLEDKVKISSPALLDKIHRTGSKIRFKRSNRSCKHIFGPENHVPLMLIKMPVPLHERRTKSKGKGNHHHEVESTEIDCCNEETELNGPGSFQAVVMANTHC